MECRRLLQKVADDVASSMSVLERLQRFQYKDANGRDHVSASMLSLSSCRPAMIHDWF